MAKVVEGAFLDGPVERGSDKLLSATKSRLF
jgi:hypothetical protein